MGRILGIDMRPGLVTWGVLFAKTGHILTRVLAALKLLSAWCIKGTCPRSKMVWILAILSWLSAWPPFDANARSMVTQILTTLSLFLALDAWQTLMAGTCGKMIRVPTTISIRLSLHRSRLRRIGLWRLRHVRITSLRSHRASIALFWQIMK